MTPPDSGEVPYKVDRFDCHECGTDVKVDEDHCCASCGRDAIEVVDNQPVGPLCDVYRTLPLSFAQRILASLERGDIFQREMASELRGRLPK